MRGMFLEEHASDRCSDGHAADNAARAVGPDRAHARQSVAKKIQDVPRAHVDVAAPQGLWEASVHQRIVEIMQKRRDIVIGARRRGVQIQEAAGVSDRIEIEIWLERKHVALYARIGQHFLGQHREAMVMCETREIIAERQTEQNRVGDRLVRARVAGQKHGYRVDRGLDLSRKRGCCVASCTWSGSGHQRDALGPVPIALPTSQFVILPRRDAVESIRKRHIQHVCAGSCKVNGSGTMKFSASPVTALL